MGDSLAGTKTVEEIHLRSLARNRRAAMGFAPAKFAGLNLNVLMILRIAGLTDVWPQYRTVEEAVLSID